VYNKHTVDVAYEEFWNMYKNCHDVCFPLKRVRFHKKNPFMTFGLLTSRNTKNKLHKLAVSEPTDENVQRYKRFKAVYFRVHCKSEDLRKYFYQVYGTLQIALVPFFGNINKKA
jgi:hypothetical protein